MHTPVALPTTVPERSQLISMFCRDPSEGSNFGNENGIAGERTNWPGPVTTLAKLNVYGSVAAPNTGEPWVAIAKTVNAARIIGRCVIPFAFDGL